MIGNIQYTEESTANLGSDILVDPQLSAHNHKMSLDARIGQINQGL